MKKILLLIALLLVSACSTNDVVKNEPKVTKEEVIAKYLENFKNITAFHFDVELQQNQELLKYKAESIQEPYMSKIEMQLKSGERTEKFLLYVKDEKAYTKMNDSMWVKTTKQSASQVSTDVDTMKKLIFVDLLEGSKEIVQLKEEKEHYVLTAEEVSKLSKIVNKLGLADKEDKIEKLVFTFKISKDFKPVAVEFELKSNEGEHKIKGEMQKVNEKFEIEIPSDALNAVDVSNN